MSQLCPMLYAVFFSGRVSNFVTVVVKYYNFESDSLELAPLPSQSMSMKVRSGLSCLLKSSGFLTEVLVGYYLWLNTFGVSRSIQTIFFGV